MNFILGEKTYALIGVGRIGRILLQQLCKANVSADHITVCDADSDQAQAAVAAYQVSSAALTDSAICDADVILFAPTVKRVPDVLQTLSPHLHAGQIVISFAAANPLPWLEALVPPGVIVVRVMPNVPSLVGQGMNPVAYGASATPEARAITEGLLDLLGKFVVVRDDQMNWCVGLSGAAMRSLLPVLEGMIQAGIEAGLSPEDARLVAGQVMAGTGALALETDLSIAQLKDLTPMQTVDETAVAQVFLEAARGAKAKIDAMQQTIWEGRPQAV